MVHILVSLLRSSLPLGLSPWMLERGLACVSEARKGTFVSATTCTLYTDCRKKHANQFSKEATKCYELEQREELGFDGCSDLGLNKWKNRPERIPTTTLNQLFTYYHYTFKLLNVLSEVMGLQCSTCFSKLT